MESNPTLLRAMKAIADQHLYDDSFGYFVRAVSLMPSKNIIGFTGSSIRADKSVGGYHAMLSLEVRLADFLHWPEVRKLDSVELDLLVDSLVGEGFSV